MFNRKKHSQKEIVSKSFLVLILQWFYLIAATAAISIPFWYKNITPLNQLEIPEVLVLLAAGALVVYCLLLSASFFTQNTNLLIFALVFIFVTTLGAVVMTIPTLPNFTKIITGNIPSCATDLISCNLEDGVLVASAMLFGAAMPILILNFITIVGAVKAIAATD